MKAFTFNCGEISEGLVVGSDPVLGPAVFLGEEGRGRHCEKIALYQSNPAEIIDNKIMETKLGVAVKNQEGKPFVITLAKAKDQEDRVLIKISTYSGYIRNARGYWEIIEGSVDCVVKGHGAFGEAGRVGTWDEGLCILRSGAVVRVFGSRYGDWIIGYKDGQLEAMDYSDWQIKQAVMNAEIEGGIEWL